jgi:GT2 family glycosyltransferase
MTPGDQFDTGGDNALPTHGSAVVSVIMINRNGGAYLEPAVATCRTAIEQALTIEPRIEFLVVDNGSTDHPEAVIDKQLHGAPFQWRIVHELKPGVNHARNAGLEGAAGRLIFLVDSDVEFDPHWLSAYLRAASMHPGARVFAGRVKVGRLEIPPPSWLALHGPLARTSIVVQCDYGEEVREIPLDDSRGPVGPNMGFRRDVFTEFGNFDTRFGLRPGSLVPGAETEMFDRLARHGLAFLFVPGATVYHPLKKSQMTKSYFRKRLHGVGRAISRLRRSRGERAMRLLGLTLNVIPRLMTAVARSIASTLTFQSPARRFHATGDVAIWMGYLHEDFTEWLAGASSKDRDGDPVT